MHLYICHCTLAPCCHTHLLIAVALLLTLYTISKASVLVLVLDVEVSQNIFPLHSIKRECNACLHHHALRSTKQSMSFCCIVVVMCDGMLTDSKHRHVAATFLKLVHAMHVVFLQICLASQLVR